MKTSTKPQRLCVRKMLSEKRLKKAMQKNGVHKLVYSVFAKDWTPKPVLKTLKPEPRVVMTAIEIDWLINECPKGETAFNDLRISRAYFGWRLYLQQTDKCFTHFMNDWYKQQEMCDCSVQKGPHLPTSSHM